MSECQRHRGFQRPKADCTSQQPYYVVRCCHIGRRFVVQIGSIADDLSHIDYVEDTVDDNVIVQAATAIPSTAEATWDEQVAQMRADVPPHPDGPVVAAAHTQEQP